jgi:acetylglutamate/LysW-gamma-L-alpha-aminoadipate kinase
MIHVLKLGGGAGVEHEQALRNLAVRVLNGEQWVLVHGCSAAANDLAQQVGCPVQTITSPGGHTSRYTDARMIEIYSAAAASVNQRLTAKLVGFGVRAVGLAGPEVIHARRKEAIRAIRDGRPVVIRDDYSGTITGTAGTLLHTLLDAGLTPVVAPVAIGEQFERLNVDGDLVAATIARELGADTLIILSNVPGLLRDASDPTSLVPHFGLSEIGRYEPLAQGRMKKKMLAAQQAGVAQVILADARVDYPLNSALNGAGTHIVREAAYVRQSA